MIKIGIVGHRFLGSSQTDFVRRKCLSIFTDARKTYNELVALSAIAEGADTIFAEAAVSLDIPLKIVTPFDSYEDDFKTTVSLARYSDIRRKAVAEIKLPYNSRSVEAYAKAMNWILINSDLLVLVWDGKDGDQEAGTVAIAKAAAKANKPWIHLDVVSLSANHHCNHLQVRETYAF
jgi:hypothetical protein